MNNSKYKINSKIYILVKLSHAKHTLHIWIYGLKIDYMNLHFFKALKKKRSGVLIYKQIKYNIYKVITLKSTLGLIDT